MTQAIKVGIFATAAVVLLAVFVLKIEDVNWFEAPGEPIEATFTSVAGLNDKAAVRYAGVRVGRVDGIQLEGAVAVVTLRIEQPLELTEGTGARITSLGLLGEKYIDLLPGSPGAPRLALGARIAGITPTSFDQTMAKLDDIATSVQGAMGPLGSGETGASLGRLIDNLEATSADIRLMIESNRLQVASTIANFDRASGALADELPRLANRLDGMLAEVQAVVGDNRESLHAGLVNVEEITSKIQVSVDNLNRISTLIADGEGTIGKLLTSDEMHTELVGTIQSIGTGVESLSDSFGKVQKLRLDLGIDGYYLSDAAAARTALNLTLTPNDQRFYYIEAVDDPGGRLRTRTDVITTTGPDGIAETTTIESRTTEDKVQLSAQFGFRLRNTALRAGLFESTGGAAVDVAGLDDRLRLSLAAFDFDREADLDPRLRLTARWRLHPNMVLLGGMDDILVGSRQSVFFGAGITWRDDDLKYLLGSLPKF